MLQRLARIFTPVADSEQETRRHLLRWKELEDGSLEFSLDWSDGYLSPLLLCTSICASLGDESRLRALLRLSKTAQHFADGQVCP